jgi:hypothetical protein
MAEGPDLRKRGTDGEQMRQIIDYSLLIEENEAIASFNR